MWLDYGLTLALALFAAPAAADDAATALALGVSETEIAELRRSVRGPLITRRDAGWANATTLNYILPSYLTPVPTLVVKARTAGDVSEAVKWAVRNRVAISPAGGRHGSLGYCNSGEVVVDINELELTPGQRFTLDEAAGTLTVSAGARLGDVIAFTDTRGYVTATGVCPGVGIAGWTLGGGYSPFGKALGIGVDNVVSFDVVLPSGVLVRADESKHPDLFWALRGAGHQSFGYVVALTIGVMRLQTFGYVTYTLPLQVRLAPIRIVLGFFPRARVCEFCATTTHILISVLVHRPTLPLRRRRSIGGTSSTRQIRLGSPLH